MATESRMELAMIVIIALLSIRCGGDRDELGCTGDTAEFEGSCAPVQRLWDGRVSVVGGLPGQTFTEMPTTEAGLVDGVLAEPAGPLSRPVRFQFHVTPERAREPIAVLREGPLGTVEVLAANRSDHPDGSATLTVDVTQFSSFWLVIRIPMLVDQVACAASALDRAAVVQAAATAWQDSFMKKHCYTACELSRTCSFGPDFTRLLGLLKEVCDGTIPTPGGSDWNCPAPWYDWLNNLFCLVADRVPQLARACGEANFDDLFANEFGLLCAGDAGQDCDACCEAGRCELSPALFETCDNGIDDDCAQGADCDDAACACMATCPNGSCDAGESCVTCPQDCQPCATCPDGSCNGGETCASCPQDCDVCPACPDGACNGAETCSSCPQDCLCPCATLHVENFNVNYGPACVDNNVVSPAGPRIDVYNTCWANCQVAVSAASGRLRLVHDATPLECTGTIQFSSIPTAAAERVRLVGQFSAGVQLRAQFGANVGAWETVAAPATTIELRVPAGGTSLVVHFAGMGANDLVEVDRLEVLDCP